MTYRSRPRHPITGRRFYVHARSQRKLDAYLDRLDRMREDLRLDLRTVEQVDRALRRMQHGPATLERACLSYLERYDLSKRTRERVRSAMRGPLAAFLSKSLYAFDTPLLDEWMQSLVRAGLWPTTILTHWRTLRMVVRHAVERGWIAGVPWGSWRPRLTSAPKRPQREAARSVDELWALLHAARDLDHEDLIAREIPPLLPADTEPKIASLALLGLRQGELAGLRWSDVDWGPPLRVLVARQWDGAPLKNKTQPKIIEAAPALALILQRHRERLEGSCLYDASGPVFPSRDSLRGSPRPYSKGEPLTRLQIRAAVERARLPSLASWSAHSLRDTFVTLEALASGGDLARVALRSRHASLASLARYLRAVTRNPAPPSLLLLAGEGEGGAAPIAHEPTTEKEP